MSNKFSRRNLLQGIGAGAISAASIGGIQSALSGFQAASAADVSGYKALVCVFLLGGADSHDVIIPYDQASYDRYAEIRASLMADYESNPGGSTRARDRLLKLNPDNEASFGGREFALTEEMSGLHQLFEEGNAAIVGNVGPLLQPLTRTEWEAGNVPTPKRLFSHNDQQSTWMASAPEGAQFGWGGRFADAALASGANANSDFTTITSLGNELFLTGEQALPYQIGLDGAQEVELLNSLSDLEVSDVLREHFRSSNYTNSNLLKRDTANVSRKAIDLNELFNQSLENLIPIQTEFPRTFIGNQLKAIAETIAIRGSLAVSRQVFFAAQGGYDSHSTQAVEVPRRLGQLDEAMTAFYRAMQEIGLGSDVTIFTASDFGRTLAINGDGTDHGWGGHHFVVGNAVVGKQIYGDIPPYDFGHDYDAGGGRLIPSTSVEQFAEPLGRWFGLNDSELATALPNFNSFTSKQALKTLLKA